jgi:hypothetical protein
MPRRFVGIDAINIAVLERAFGKRDLLGLGIHQQCTFDEDTLVISTKVYSAAEIKSLSVKDFIPHHSLFVDFGHVIFVFRRLSRGAGRPWTAGTIVVRLMA